MTAMMFWAPVGMAETLLNAEQYDGISLGKTIYLDQGDEFYGAEQHFEGRRTMWKQAGGECVEGFWYQEGDAICFTYPALGDTACWLIFQTDVGIKARLVGADPMDDLLIVAVDTNELLCETPFLNSNYPKDRH